MTTSDTPLIQARDVSKSYGVTRAVDKVSFEVRRGEIRGFLGPNGAGKSTTIRIVTGYLAADSGSVRIAGLDVATATLEARKRIGYLPESFPLYREMRVDEYLRFVAASHGLDRRRTAERIEYVLDALELARMTKRLTGTLSKGYRQRVGLAQAIIHDPDILILDEPTNGLDPHQIIEIRALLSNLARGKAILFSTHILQEISAICSRIMIIRGGRIIADDTPVELARAVGSEGTWEVVISGRDRLADAERAKLGGGVVESDIEHRDGRLLRLAAHAPAPEVEALALALAGIGRRLLQVRREERTLEQVYLTLTAGAPNGRASA